jgi:zinc and cadmium transporter
MNFSLYAAAATHFALVLSVGLVPLSFRFEGGWYDALLSFGAGVLLSAAFLHMIPEAAEGLGPKMGAFVLLGFLLMVIIERFTMAHPCGEELCPSHRIGNVAFFGLSVHSVISGIALGVGLAEHVDIATAVAMMSAILVHKIPETIALMGLFRISGWSKQRMFFFLLLFCCMGPLGILFGGASGLFAEKTFGAAMAISAGTFLYIACSGLLPHLHKKMRQKNRNFIAFLLGLFALSIEAWHHLAS